MITEFFIWLGQTVTTWFLSLLPDDDWSDGLVLTASNAISSLFVAAGQISNWFPWAVMLWAATTVVTLYFVMFTIKIVKNLLSHLPLFGGTG